MNAQKRKLIAAALLLAAIRRRRATVISRHRRRPRKFWVHPINLQRQSLGHYQTLYAELRSDESKFYNYTRMRMGQFDQLDAMLSSTLVKHSIREPIPPTMRLLMTLRYYASGDSLASISYNYRVGRSTATNIVRETGIAIWEILSPVYLAPPTKDEFIKIAAQFREMWNVPNCVGAMDGKHVVVKRPQQGGSTFYNYKKDNSIVLMACVDACMRFLYVNVGAQGSLPDSAVFRNSRFGTHVLEGKLPLPPPSALPGSNITVPHYFLADDAFPLHQNIMKPYSQLAISGSVEKKEFNYRQSRGRMVVERAFGVMAGKWQILYKPLTCSVTGADVVVKACTCLHNFLIATGNPADDVALGHAATTEPTNIRGLTNLAQQERTEPGYATQVREKLTTYFFSPAGSVPWQVGYVLRQK